MKVKFVFAALVATALSVSSAGAAQPAAFQVRIEGYVPVVCRATVETAAGPAQGGVMQLGRLKEFCNNANGYEVWIDYSPQLAGSVLLVDGHAVRLSGDQSVRISQSRHAASLSRDLALDLQGQAADGSLSVRVVPL